MKKIFLMLCVFCTLIVAGEIKIAVAANVSYAIGDLKQAFMKYHPETKVQVILGSSGKLSAQISHGAPFGLFMSANMKYPTTLYEEKSAITKPVVYAKGALALLSVNAQDFSQGIAVLENTKIDKIAIANPKTAPYGVAAKEALENAKLYEKIKSKFVYGESISQTVTYATTAADIGIVAKSSLFSPHMVTYKKEKHWVDVNASLYTPIDQGMVILKSGEKNPEVKAFYDFMLSAKAKAILERYGYKVK
jgi:molybdate transport system substrate-binding protein